jgi:hypothetical protein
VVSVYIGAEQSPSEERFQTERRENRDLTFPKPTFTADGNDT